MISGSLPRRYARALIQLAQDAKQLEGFGQALRSLSNVLRQTPDFLSVLSNDLIDFNQRLAAMEAIAAQWSFPLYLKNFLFILVRKERVALLPEIVREFERFEDEILGIVRVTVETPSVPDTAILDRVGKILSQKLKKKVIAEGKADPSMIGGMILKVDHTVYDGSVERELERIKENMLKG